MAESRVVASGYVKTLTWHAAVLRIINEDGSETEQDYELTPWEYYAAWSEPTFDVDEITITADDVSPEVAVGFNLQTAANPEGEPHIKTWNLRWRADFETYKQYVPADQLADDDVDGISIEVVDEFGAPIPDEHASVALACRSWDLEASRAAHGPNVILDPETGDCQDITCLICYASDEELDTDDLGESATDDGGADDTDNGPGSMS